MFLPSFKQARSAFITTLSILFYRFYIIALYDYRFWVLLLSLLLLLLLFLLLLWLLLFLLLSLVFLHFNAINFYCPGFYYSALDLCINQVFLSFKHMTRPNIAQSVCIKDTETVSVMPFVPLTGNLNNVYHLIHSLHDLL